MSSKQTYSLLLILAVVSIPSRAGLIHRWALDEDAATAKLAADSVGDLDGSIQGPTSVDGKVAKAFRFDGSNDEVQIQSFTAPLQGTVVLWINPRLAKSKERFFGTGGDYEIWLRSNGELKNELFDNGNTTLGTGAGAVKANEWYQAAFTYDGATAAVEIYLNGELKIAGKAQTPSIPTGTTLLLGHRSGAGAAEHFGGILDDVQVYDEVLAAAQIKSLYEDPGSVISAATAKAGRPVPADEANDVPRDVILTWTPGKATVSRDVYLGTNPDDVSKASIGNPMNVLRRAGHDANTFDPGPLELGTTYYWRVDEVNGPPDRTVYPGDVWTFTTEPVAYLIPDVQATASSSASAGTGPANMVNGSGLTLAPDGQYVHDEIGENMWQSAAPGLPATVAFQFDRTYKLHKMKIWNHNTVNESFLGLGAREVTIEIADSNTGPWTPLADVTLTKAPGAPGTAATDTISMPGVMAGNVRLTIRSAHGDAMPAAGLAEVQFFYLPVAPRELEPADGTALTSTEATLAWRSGREAAQHEVYLATGDKLDLVQSSDPSVLAATITAQGSYASYAASDLSLSQTYLWKIAEVNSAETPATHDSPILSFTTPQFELVDDMESYSNEPFKEIWATWLDGTDFGTKDPTNGSTVGVNPALGDYSAASGRNGGQSLPIWFNNTAAAPKSEAIRTSAFGDWTAHGIKSLSLWFYGDPGNSGQLYVKINNTKVLYDGDPTDIKKASWQPFNIDLSKVAATLTNVTKLAVGVEGVGATGIIRIDDIRLYGRAPESITPVQPDTANLLAYYDFEGNANDRSGHGLNGTLVSAQLVSPGKLGQGTAIQLDGTGHVDLGNPALLDFGTGDWAVTVWFKTAMTGTGETNKGTIFAKGGDGIGGHRYTLAMSETTVGIVSLTCDDDVTKEQAHSTTRTNDDQWHFVVGQREGTSIKIYIDGQLEDTEPVAAAYDLAGMSQHKAYIGTITNHSDSTLAKRFVGLIDDVRVYNRALSEAEIFWLADKTMPVAKPF